MRYVSEWFHVSVTLRYGELCVVDWYDVAGSVARTTQLYPAIIGKLVRESALPRPSIDPSGSQVEENAKQKWVQAVGATGERNLYRTTANVFAASDGQETRFYLEDPVVEDDGPFSTALAYSGLSSRLPERIRHFWQGREESLGIIPLDLTQLGNRILIAPWHDPEMLGQAILNILAEALPPERDPKGSVFDRPRPKQRIKLHLAAAAGDLSPFPKSTRGSRSFDPTDSEGVTPLMLAGRHGSSAVVERLLFLGADPSRADERGQTPLHHAAAGGHAPAVDLLVDAGAPLEAIDDVGRTPLHIAAAQGQGQVVVRLLECGAPVNVKDGEYQSTPLHLAARGGHAHVVPPLLGMGAEVNSVNEAGRTPLHVAASYGHATFVQALIEGGADVNRQDANGETPLFRPVFFQHEDVLRILINAGGDVRVTNGFRDALLHVAAMMNRERAATILLDSGADTEALNAEGLTPLDCALVNPHFDARPLWPLSYMEHNAEVAELLAQRGATVDPMRLPVAERHVMWPHLTPTDLLLPSGDIDEVHLFLGRGRRGAGISTPWRAAWRTLQGYVGKGFDEKPLSDERWTALPESVRDALELASRTQWQPHHLSKYVLEAESLLHDAVSKDMPGFLAFLLSHGASQSPKTYGEENLLHFACGSGRVEAARILLDRGADIEAPRTQPERLSASARALGRHTRPGWTPLDTAIRSLDLRMIAFLLDRGAKPPDRLEDAEAASSWALYRFDRDGNGFDHPLNPFLAIEKGTLDALVDLFDSRGAPILGADKRRDVEALRAEEQRREARREASKARRASRGE